MHFTVLWPPVSCGSLWLPWTSVGQTWILDISQHKETWPTFPSIRKDDQHSVTKSRSYYYPTVGITRFLSLLSNLIFSLQRACLSYVELTSNFELFSLSVRISAYTLTLTKTLKWGGCSPPSPLHQSRHFYQIFSIERFQPQLLLYLPQLISPSYVTHHGKIVIKLTYQ